MNIQEMISTMTNKYAKQIAEATDSVAFAYVTKQYDYLVAKGEDPTEYEVVFAKYEYPQKTDDGMVMTQHIRLVKVKEVENLPVSMEVDEL
jgi:hypothetical protein